MGNNDTTYRDEELEQLVDPSPVPMDAYTLAQIRARAADTAITKAVESAEIFEDDEEPVVPSRRERYYQGLAVRLLTAAVAVLEDPS